MTDREARKLADGFLFLEAPKWRDGRIWMSDVFASKIYTVTLDGAREDICHVPGRPAGLGFLPDGRLIIASQAERKLFQWKDGALSVYADLTAATPYFLNDFAIDGRGRVYVGNFGYDLYTNETPKPTNLLRVDPDGTIAEAATGLDFPNGSVILGGRTLVVNETFVGRVTAFDLTEDGRLVNRRLFADLPGRGPDGMCADAEGALWIGCYLGGEILRVRDGGEITDRIKFDGRGISCDLGGPDGKTLFMTAFLGPDEEVPKGKPLSALFSAAVDVGR